jgi:hypothetical protein
MECEVTQSDSQGQQTEICNCEAQHLSGRYPQAAAPHPNLVTPEKTYAAVAVAHAAPAANSSKSSFHGEVIALLTWVQQIMTVLKTAETEDE